MKNAITILFLLAMPSLGQSRVELSLATTDEVWAGQEVDVHVDLLVPGYFSGIPFFSLPQMPGALVQPPAGSPVVGSREIDGVTYTVQRHDLEVVPSRGGKVELPPFDIRVTYKRQPLDKDVVTETVKTTAIDLAVKMPPGMEGEAAITSSTLEVTETWTPEPGKDVKAGDAFVREIRWEAGDAPVMVLPPFDPGKIAGLGIYQKTPDVTETKDRGSSRSVRVDRVTYVCKTGGDFVIPAVSFKWWDPEKKELRKVDFPERKFHVPAPPLPPETFAEKVDRLWRAYGKAALAVFVGLVVLVVFAWLTRAWWRVFFRRLRPRHLVRMNPGPIRAGP